MRPKGRLKKKQKWSKEQCLELTIKQSLCSVRSLQLTSALELRDLGLLSCGLISAVADLQEGGECEDVKLGGHAALLMAVAICSALASKVPIRAEGCGAVICSTPKWRKTRALS